MMRTSVAAVIMGVSLASAAAVGSPVTIPDTLSLPQYDSSNASRGAAINATQAAIQDGTRFWQVDTNSTFYEISNGPQPGNLYFFLVESEVQEFQGRLVNRTDAIAGPIVTGVSPLTTVDDLTNVYEYFTGIEYPPALHDWQSDSSFAADRLTYHGYSLEASTSNWFNLTEDIVRNITGTCIEDLIVFGRLFQVDHTDFFQYSRRLPASYVPGAAAQFFLDETGTLKPLAIYLVDNGLVYTPLDNADHWQLAKLAFNTAEAVFYPTEHFVVSHWIMEPARLEMMRHVSTLHPVYALLDHHFKDLFGLTYGGLHLLFETGTQTDEVLGTGAAGAVEYMSKRALSYDFAREMLEIRFLNRGVSFIPEFKFRDDLLAVREIIYRFVRSYLRTYYVRGDIDVVLDSEIQAWVAAVASPTGGNVKNFPATLDCFDELVNLVTELIAKVAILHHSMNSNLQWDAIALPAKPFALYAPLPADKISPVNLRSYYSANPIIIITELLVKADFVVPISANETLTYSYQSTYLGGSDNANAVSRFVRECEDLASYIEAREASNPRYFNHLSPSRLPYYVWI